MEENNLKILLALYIRFEFNKYRTANIATAVRYQCLCFRFGKIRFSHNPAHINQVGSLEHTSVMVLTECSQQQILVDWISLQTYVFDGL